MLKEAHTVKSQIAKEMRAYTATNASEILEQSSKPNEREIVVLKQQKKLIKDDLEEILPSNVRLEDAYAKLIMNKVMAASSKQKKKRYN